MRQAVLRPLEGGRVGRYLVASAFRRTQLARPSAAFGFRGQNKSTATQQGAAPDRLQPCVSLASSLHFGLPAAGELSRCVAARGFNESAAVFGLFALGVAAFSVL